MAGRAGRSMGIHWEFGERTMTARVVRAGGALRAHPLMVVGGLAAVAAAMIAVPTYADRGTAASAAVASDRRPENVYLGRLADAPNQPLDAATAAPEPAGIARFRGRLNEGLVVALGDSGVSADVARGFLATIADSALGLDIGADDHFDLVVDMGQGRPTLIYAALDRVGASDVQLVKVEGRWIDAGGGDSSGAARPVGGRVTSRYGIRHHPLLGYSRMHKGVDFAAAYGSPVVAAASGRIIGAGWAGGYGRQVKIAHGGGLSSSYSHLSRFAVGTGGFVRAGQVIGYAGSSGFSTGPHVHYEVRRNGVPVDPLGARLADSAPLDPNMQAKLADRIGGLMRLAPQPRG